MGKFIIIDTGSHELFVNTEHILFIKHDSGGKGTIMKLDAPYNGDTVTIYSNEDYEVIKNRILNRNKIIKTWGRLRELRKALERRLSWSESK